MMILLVAAAPPTGALGLNVEAAGVGVATGTLSDSPGASTAAVGVNATVAAGTSIGGGVQAQATARAEVPLVGVTAEVSAGAAVSPSEPAAVQVSATLRTPTVETGAGGSAPTSRPPAEPGPPRPGSAPAGRPPLTPPSARRPPSRTAPEGAVGSSFPSPAQSSAAISAARPEGSTIREKLRAAAAAAARGIAALLAILAAFGLYLAVQRRLDRGPRMAWAGDGQHSPDDETLYF